MAARFASVTRFILLPVAVCGALRCSYGDIPAPPDREPWTLEVQRPTGQSATDTAWRCLPDDTGCQPLHAGEQFQAPVLVRSARGTGDTLRLGPGVVLELANATSVRLRDETPRTIELLEGSATLLADSDASNNAPRLIVADATIALGASDASVVSARAGASGTAAVTVQSGQAVATGASGVSIELRGGETARLQRGQGPDKRAAWSGDVFPVEPIRTGNGEVAPVSAEPRGLGRMTARVPGSEQVVSGVELVTHRANVDIRDGFARTEVEEEFYNATDRVLEGRYVFPLPPRASISRLALWVNDKLVEGEVVERKRAASIFKGIVEDTVRPRDPALLEWVSGAEFSLKIFPIPPHKSRRVVLAYNEVLPSESGRMRYVYPLSLGADRATKIDDFRIMVSVRGAGPEVLELLAAPYSVRSERTAKAATVHFDARSFVPASDFVVSWAAPRQPDVPLVTDVPEAPQDGGRPLAERSAGESESAWFALRLRADLPSNADAPALSRVRRAIVLDKSASQGKESWEAESRLALALVRNMAHDEAFVVLACDTDCASFPEQGLRDAGGDAASQVGVWLEGLSMSGASDVGGAIAAGARRLAAGPSRGQLVYVGDGRASAGDLDAESIAAAVSGLVRESALDIRLVGAGRSVDEVMLSGLARSLGATFEPLASGESLDTRMDEIATHTRSPIVESPVVELPEGFSEVYPRVLPNLRLGEETVLVGRMLARTGGNIVLRGRLAGTSYQLAKPLSWPAEEQRRNPLVPRIWAESRVAELSASNAKDAVREIIELSKRHHVMSRHTALLVLENDQMFSEFGIERTQRTHAAGSDTALRSHARGSANPPDDAFGMVQRLGQVPETGGGDMWGDRMSDSFGAGGLGLSGVGEGGGGQGEGIGLGSLGTIGHGAGTAAGQGFGSGNGRLGGAHTTHPPQVRMGATTVSGRVPPEVIQRIVRQNYGRFRACYEAGLRANPNLQGRVAVRFVIARDGSVANVGDAGSDLPDASVVSCVRTAFYGLNFPQPEGGIVTVVYPIMFSAGDAGGGGSSAPESRPRTWDNTPTPSGLPGSEQRVLHRAEDDAWRERGESALETLRRAVDKTEQSRKAHAALVTGLLRRGRIEAALQAGRRFVELDPDLPLAHELLGSAEALANEPALAASSLAAVVELSPSSARNQMRVARAYEALLDEVRACAHWRAASRLSGDRGYPLFEALRCSARVLGQRDASLAAARAITQPDDRISGLIAALEKGNAPAYDPKLDAPGGFEVEVTCEDSAKSCPTPVVIDPSGKVFSPSTPSGTRASRALVSFSPTGGEFHTLLVGGAPDASGKVRIQAQGIPRTFEFSHGGTQAVAATTVPQRW